MSYGNWTVVVPLKPAERGKSRLGADPALVRAIGLNTAAGAADVTEVVVTADPVTAEAVADMERVRVVCEESLLGLNHAIALAMPSRDRDSAALLGDLPALRPDDLRHALNAAAGVVADREGTGSTLITARTGWAWASDVRRRLAFSTPRARLRGVEGALRHYAPTRRRHRGSPHRGGRDGHEPAEHRAAGSGDRLRRTTTTSTISLEPRSSNSTNFAQASRIRARTSSLRAASAAESSVSSGPR